MLPIDRYAYNNKLSGVHPAEKFFFAVITLMICLCASNLTTSLAVFFTMAGAVVFCAGIPPGFYLKLMTIPMSFLFLGVLTVAVSVGGAEAQYVFSFHPGPLTLGVTMPGLYTAVDLFFKSLGAVACLYFLSLTTPMVEIILVLKKLHFPSIFIEMMSVIYRFIFLLMDTAGLMYTAQSSRLGYQSVKSGFVSLSKLVTNLFLKAYHQADTLSVSLMSRCYNGDLNVLAPEYTISRKNIAIIGLVDMVLAAVSLLQHGGYLFGH